MKAIALLIAALFSSAAFAQELDQVKSMTLTSALELRVYVDAGDSSDPQSLTAYSQQNYEASCTLSLYPANKTLDKNLLQRIDSEPRFPYGRVDIYALKGNLKVYVQHVKSEINEFPEPCALPSHPETCDPNPPLVKEKSVALKMSDASENLWDLNCTSSSVYSDSGKAPTLDISKIKINGNGIIF